MINIKYKRVKLIRQIVALLLLLLVTAPFSYHLNRSSSFFSFTLKGQFLPSLLGILSGGALFFIILLFLTLLFGRFYCSFLCPLGIYQDLSTRVANLFKSKRKRRHSYREGSWVRYLFLSVVFISLILGFTTPLALFDPYSIWGRVSTHLLPISFVGFTLLSFLISLTLFLVVTLFSAFRGRLYCNTICPIGALLGLISKASLFKIKIDKEKCTNCRLCVIHCKGHSIDLKNHRVDNSRCILCFNCTAVCKFDAIHFTNSWREKGREELDHFSEGRRESLITLALLGGAITAKSLRSAPLISDSPKESVIAPPGALSITHLKENCTACHACIAACPSNIIKPSLLDYGIDGILLPTLDFTNNYCHYDCNSCTVVCPNNALIELPLTQKRVTQIGKVRFRPKRCIVYTDGTPCGLCYDHCPTEAIEMVPFGDEGLYIPAVRQKFCIGCGACQYYCPAEPQKAMMVFGEPEQRLLS